MVETNITRRRVMQGAGVVGVTGALGTTVVVGQEDNETGNESAAGEDQAALRVAHASPDAPEVEVRVDDEAQAEGLAFRQVSSYFELDPGSHQVQLVVTDEGLVEGFIEDIFGDDDEDEETVIFDEQMDLEAGTTYTAIAYGEARRGPVPAEGEGTEGNETDVGGDQTDVGGNQSDTGNETDVGTGGNESDVGGDDNDTDVGGNETGTGNETDTGAGAGAGVGDQVVENLAFGEHQSFEMEAGDYTLEISEAGAGGALTDGGTETAGGNQTDTGNETDVTAGNDTDVGTGNETAGNATTGNETDAGGALGQEEPDRRFQVQLVEDDLSDPGEDTFRLRIFHAVPDVDAMSITATEAEGDGGLLGDGGDENESDGNATGGNESDGGVGGDDETAGNESGGGVGDGNETGTGNETAAGDDESVQERDISPSGASVYSGFAVGYFDPEEAAGAGNQTDNESDGGLLGDGNETEDNETAGNETGGDATDGNATGGNETEGEEIAEDAEGEEFELVTVRDSNEGERSDGGTDDGLF